MSAIILKDSNPSSVPTPDTGKTAFITYNGDLYIKDDTGTVTQITSGGTVTSIAASSGDGTITITGSPITTSGTLGLSVDQANLSLSSIGGSLDLATQVTGTLNLANITPGTSGQVLTMSGSTVTWSAPSSGSVTSVDVTGANGIGVSGAPITSSGTISLSLGNITPTSVAASGTVTGSNLSGTNTGDQTITLTGDVTGSGTSSFAATIASGAVSLSKMANLAANSIIGNNTGSAATPIALTQAQFTAMVNTFSSSLSGAVPASGGGTSNFLRADGTWAAPAGGSGTVTSVDVSGGTTGLTFSGGPVTSTGTLTLGGTLAIANGGTGATTKTDAFDALAPTTTVGDLIYHNGTDNVRLGIGSDGQVLTVASGAPSWAAASGGGSVYYKDPVRAATTAAGTLASSFQNGSAVDGVTLATGDRILIKNQSSAVENGIYTVNASGAPTRATDMDANAEVQRGCVVYVQFGTVNGGSNFQVVSSNGTPIVVGTSTIVWLPVNGMFGGSLNTWAAPTSAGQYSVAIGTSASPGSASCVAIGRSATVDPSASSGAVAIGYSALVNSSSDGAVSIGQNSNITNSAGQSVAIGYNAAAGKNNTPGSIAIGANSSATQGVAIGSSAGAGTNSWTSYAIAIGPSALAQSGSTYTHTGGISIGYSCNTTIAGAQDTIGHIAIGMLAASGYNSAVALGSYAKTESAGEVAFGLGRFAAAADAKSSVIMGYMTTTTATPTEVGLTTNAASTTPTNKITLTNDSSYIFDCDIIARNTANDTETAGWNLKFVIRRGTNAASTSLVGSATKTVLAQDTGTTTWDVSVTADTTNGRPNISVTGEAAKTIRWVANIRMTKVSG